MDALTIRKVTPILKVIASESPRFLERASTNMKTENAASEILMM